MIAYIGLGANLADPVSQLQTACAAIAALPGVRVLGCSPFYRSSPLGPADQPDYVNAVMAVETDDAPLDFLRQLQAIETQQGRVRSGNRWGPRTLDLDLLLYGDQVIATAELTVPHPGLSQREFVLYPLRDVAPADLVVPGVGRLADLIAGCPLRGLAALEEA
ncbi:MAG: 2-amino-4-hydroxy-6-hydroxymethyldihydropteridine diphosphokinase [Methylococcaceae bacterium]|nr:2-amino-4-hydroxy-6-hydroxymethyldihydropteridine diphosphokinase [Methylococcaceae bacterium]